MEPRPQSSRPAQEPTAPRRSPSPADGGGTGQAGSFQQPDPTTIVAPPRADYDYSPLDLAPPGQRRRRQLVAAVLGGLVMLMLVAAIVFAFLLLRDEDGEDDGENSIAAAQTEVARSRATLSAQETMVAAAAGSTEAPEGAANSTAENDDGGAATGTTEGDAQSTAGDAAGQAIDPTDEAPAANNAAGSGPLSQEELTALLPDGNIMPQGLDVVTDSTRTEAEVVTALGGSRDAETRLQNWGWTANVEREFKAAETSTLPLEATTDITVSLHGFASDEAAAEALTYYSDFLVGLGYQEGDPVEVGATSRMMVQTQEDGGTVVALYVQKGSVLYRFGGYSPAGDPTTNVLNVAREVVAP